MGQDFGIFLISDSMPGMDPGLCANCRHVKALGNARGSVFYMCTLAERDSRFLRYPPLPVRSCDGYERASSAPTPANKEEGPPPK